MDTFLLINNEEETHQIMQCQDIINQYGLILTREDGKDFITTRQNTLKDIGRIEFRSTIIQQLIEEFCDCTFINKYNFPETMNALIEIFYYYKDAMEEILSDEEIIHYLKYAFEGRCQGSLELLAEEQLDDLIDAINHHYDIFEDLRHEFD